MNRMTFWSIFLLWVISAGHCSKKYLVEVADDQGAVTQANAEAPQDLEEANDEVDLEVDEAINEFESKYDNNNNNNDQLAFLQ